MPRLRPHRHGPRARLVAAGIVALTALGLGLGPPVGAQSISNLQEQAEALEAEINANAEQLSALNEQIKGVQLELDAANATIVDAQARIETAREETQRLKLLLRARAAAIYRSASNGVDSGLFELDVQSFSSRQQYAAAASEQDNALVDQLGAARKDLSDRQAEAQDAKDAAQAQKDQLDAVKGQFEAANAERQALLDQVEGEIADLVEAAAAARRAAQGPGPGFDPGQLPPPGSGGAGAAVGFAHAQIGKPYCYAGVGPSCFDCSGLTMAAWRTGGVFMGHNDRSQINSFPNVPMGAIIPGDILWYPGHVAIYVGGGTAIDSPHTGAFVRYQGIGSYQRAARPG